MGMRESMRKNPAFAAGGAALLVLIAGFFIARNYWPQKTGDLLQAWYSDDDGASWFADSVYKVAPFDHNGKTAAVAEVYSYADGKKQFCGYLMKYTPEAKRELEQALDAAKQQGRDPGSVSLYQSQSFMNRTLVKLPGAGNPWVPSGDPKARDIRTVHSPDGSALDSVVVY